MREGTERMRALLYGVARKDTDGAQSEKRKKMKRETERDEMCGIDS